MTHEQQHEMLCGILTKLVDSNLTSDELSLLAHSCGIHIEDFYYPAKQKTDLFTDLKEAA